MFGKIVIILGLGLAFILPMSVPVFSQSSFYSASFVVAYDEGKRFTVVIDKTGDDITDEIFLFTPAEEHPEYVGWSATVEGGAIK